MLMLGFLLASHPNKAELEIIQSAKIIKSEKHIPCSYSEMNEEYKQKIPLNVYDEYVNKFNMITDVEFFKIAYLSDGLKVNGFIVKPKNNLKVAYPLVIYNRGGYKEDGKIDVIDLCNNIYFLSQNGYVVLASQYRGNDGSEGKDECGGSEINDILNLIKIAPSLDFVDHKNMFMLGFSRGGIMTYLALKNGISPNAVAVIAGISNMDTFVKSRPDMEKFITSILDPQKDKELEYTNRSISRWSEVITTPILPHS